MRPRGASMSRGAPVSLAGRVAVTLLLWLFAAWGLAGASLAAEAPAPRDGVLDLRAWSPLRDGALDLAGAWRFVPGALLPPQDAFDRATGRAPVPGAWNDLPGLGGKPMGSLGAGTYVLRVLLPVAPEEPLALQMGEFYTTARVFVNGEEVINFGTPALEAAQDTPRPGRAVAALPVATLVDVVVHVSNHLHERGGALYVPRIGTLDAFEANAFAETAMNLTAIGSLGAMGLFYLLLHLVRQRDQGYLIFFVINLLGILRILSAARLVYQFWPGASHAAVIYVEYVDLYLLVPANLTLMAWLFPREFHAGLIKALWALGAAMAILGLIASVYWLTWTRTFLTLYVGVSTLYGAVGIARAAWRGRPGAVFMVGAGLVASTLILHDVLANLHVIEAMDIAAFAYVTFAFGHGVVLGQRIETALVREERLTQDLANLNQSLEAQVQERTRHLEIEVDRRAQAERAAEKASAAKSEFLATMSHEIRTPLNGVIGIANILAEDAVDADQRTRLRALVNSGELLLSIVSDILDFSKIEAGQFEIHPGPVAPRDLIEDVVSLFRPLASAKALALSVEIDPAVPDHVLVDGNRLRQIAANLIGNAVKFTQSGGVRVDLRVDPTAVEGGGPWLVMSVADSGVGIAAPDLEHLFQPFVQLRQSLSDGRSGTGLGLSISSRLAQLMAGRITVTSEVGRGSVFRLHLPLIPAAAPDATETANPAAGALGPSVRLTVLVVDDSEINRVILAEFVRREGHDAIMAADGAEALARVRAEAPDLVFMDLSMPGMDGFDACVAIRALDEPLGSIPIVAASATTQEAVRQRCLAIGMNGFLTKPIRRADVARVIGEQAAAIASARGGSRGGGGV